MLHRKISPPPKRPQRLRRFGALHSAARRAETVAVARTAQFPHADRPLAKRAGIGLGQAPLRSHDTTEGAS